MKIYQINIIEIHKNKGGGAGNPNFLLSNFDWKVKFSLYTKFAVPRLLLTCCEITATKFYFVDDNNSF